MQITPFLQRIEQPKSDVVAAYIGYVGNELRLCEVNLNNQTIRAFLLSEDDAGIPADALAEAQSLRGQAFNQVKIYTQPGYIEYYHRHNTKRKKQSFWVRDEAKYAA